MLKICTAGVERVSIHFNIVSCSVAILKYLAVKFNVADHWYPRQDLQLQARVDEYMNWQHLNTRINAAMLFQNLVRLPRASKTEWSDG